MTVFSSCLLFALACNLDTVLLAVGFRLRGTRLSAVGVMVIAAVTTGITLLSLELGRETAMLLDPSLSGRLGGLVLLAMGLWFLLDGLRCPAPKPEFASGTKTNAAWVSLAAALGVNNAAAGVAAGVSGVDPLLGGAINFAITFVSLALGHLLGKRAQEASGRFGRWALPASGLLLAALGALELIL